jgi:hypothetical protein
MSPYLSPTASPRVFSLPPPILQTSNNTNTNTTTTTTANAHNTTTTTTTTNATTKDDTYNPQATETTLDPGYRHHVTEREDSITQHHDSVSQQEDSTTATSSAYSNNTTTTTATTTTTTSTNNNTTDPLLETRLWLEKFCESDSEKHEHMHFQLLENTLALNTKYVNLLTS